MKPLFLLAVVTAPLLMTSCVVDHEVYYRRHHPNYHPYRREVVVEASPVGVVYYTDVRGRYYWRQHRRVYVTYY